MKNLLVAAFLALAAVPALAQPAADADVRRLILISGTLQSVQNLPRSMIDHYITMVHKYRVDIPAPVLVHAVQETVTEYNAAFDKAMLDQLVPLYQKRLTSEDVRQLLAFYETPLGKKLASTQPWILKEVDLSARQWGDEQSDNITGRVDRSLRMQGYPVR